ncbi:hypothetical protein FOL47_006982 [Perkinsus chesapeaki]|uniref:Uncharacterized protein n=1 Tax=Perkinsus chesapeaki TaxID=330153 RepID=A0A7J6N511_PERCH|nr:hypothetical protein FOL47_006982 [Perkinsus chesapeaki]
MVTSNHYGSPYAPTRGGYPDDDIIDDRNLKEINTITGMLPGVVEQETPQQLASFIIEMSKEISNLEEALRVEKEKTSHQADEISILLQQIQSLSPTNSVNTRSSSDDQTTPCYSHRNRSPSSVRGLKSPAEIIKDYGIDEASREALNKSPLLATRSRRQRVADMFMSVIQAMNADSPDKASQPEVPKTVSSSEGDIACLTSLDYSTIFKECVKAVQQQVAPTTERRWDNSPSLVSSSGSPQGLILDIVSV